MRNPRLPGDTTRSTGRHWVQCCHRQSSNGAGVSPLDEREPCRGSHPMIPISKMAAAVQPSATLAAGARAKQMKAEGLTVFDFSLGEPDFPTPEPICAAATRAMREGQTRYTPAS